MKVKLLVVSMLVGGVACGTALAANQRGDIAGLRERLKQGSNQVYTKSNDNWFAQHVSVNGQINVDAAISDSTRVSPRSGQLGPNGVFLNPALDLGRSGRQASSDISIANSVISVDLQPTSWVNGHIEFSGQDEERANIVRANVVNGTLVTAHTSTIHFVTMDEALVTLGDLAQSSFFVSAGRRFVQFGYYNDPYALTYSLPQELSEINATTLTVGYAQPCGFSIDGYIFRGNLRRVASTNAAGQVTNFHAVVNNGGVDAGYVWDDGQGMMGFDVGGGWLYNMVEARAIYPVLNTLNGGYTSPVGGWSAHLGGFWNQFDASTTWVGATRRFNAVDFAQANNATRGARPYAGSVEVGYGFNAWGHEQRLAWSYQRSWEGNAVDTVGAIAIGLGLPEHRYQVDWTMGLAKNTNLQFQYTHDRDYSVARGGTGLRANTGKVRLNVGFL